MANEKKKAPAARKTPAVKKAPAARKAPAVGKARGKPAPVAPKALVAVGPAVAEVGAKARSKPGARGRTTAKAAKGAPKPKARAAGQAAAVGKIGAVGKACAAGKAKATRKAPSARKPPQRAKGPPRESIDPEGYFIARVRGEEAVRQAPHPMTEDDVDAAVRMHPVGEIPVPAEDEGLGDLPWSYGADVFVALPRDPHTLFLYWDHAEETRARAFEWLDQPRAQLWVFAEAGGAWERVRVVEFALEARGFYVHDLEPGRTYRAEIHVVDRRGRERPLAEPSNPVALPPSGPSAVIDDLFARIPWDVPLERWIRELRAGGTFPSELRDLLARLSDWSRFRPQGAGDRPTSPEGGWEAGAGSGRGKGAGSGDGKGGA
jgi:hypothetical protein